MRPNYFLLVLITVLICVVTTEKCSAQLEVWKNADTCFYFHTRSLTSLPPLRSDMPLDILVSWIVMDSLCKKTSTRDLDRRLTTMTTDSIKLVLKYYYKLADFDPLLLLQYGDDIRYIGVNYKNSPRSIYGSLARELMKRNEINDFIKLLIEADFILRVKVQSKTIQTVWCPTCDISGPYEWFCADLEVLEKIKGQKIYPICDTVYGGGARQPLDQPECTRIIWSRLSPSYAQTREDSIRLEQLASRLEVGKEYIVFFNDYSGAGPLNNSYRWLRGGIDIYMPTTEERYECGACFFRIENDLVFDPANKFGLGTSVPKQQFEDYLKNSIRIYLGL